MRARFAIAALAIFTLTATRPLPAVACCPAYPREQRVQIAAQEILVTWNPATKTEHFVRRASFESTAKGFGFLVPTPTQPELSAVANEVFERLGAEIRPRIVDVTKYRVAPAAVIMGFFPVADVMAPRTASAPVPQSLGGAPVRVLAEKLVAGYDTTVLEADDAGALADWLKARKFDARPELEEWLEPYVAAKWKVTAFRFAGDEGVASTPNVRMSFKTEKPVFPYRVPKDQIAPPGQQHLLRVFYVGPGRAKGTLGANDKPWNAEMKYTAPLVANMIDRVVPPADIAQGAWLTAFEDPTWPGGTEDLWFGGSSETAQFVPTIERVTWKTIPVPLDVLVVIGIVLIVVVRRRNKNK